MLLKRLQDDQITFLKQRQQEKLTVLRYILAQIKNKKIDTGKELTDEEILTVLRKIAKELNESIDAFEKGGRRDLVDEYKKQLEVVKVYLPAEIFDEQLKKEIEATIAKNKDIYQKNPKIIIGLCMKALKNKAAPERIMKMLSHLSPNS